MLQINSICMEKCRLCHNYPGVHELNSEDDLLREVMDCTNIQVSDTFGLLPRSVCVDCKRIINNFHKYKQYVRGVDETLRQILLAKADEERNLDMFLLDYESVNNVVEGGVKESKETGISQSLNSVVKEIEYLSEVEVSAQDFFCCHCSEQFNTADELNTHEKKAHKNTFICNQKKCGKLFNTAYALKVHGLKHDGKRLFLCITCGKSFLTKNSLNCHEKTHLEVKAYFCDLCNLSFSVRSNLRAHDKKYHLGVRFYCSKCTREFVSKSSLDRHEKVHTGVRDFQCGSCPSAFYTKKELLKHQRYHQGLKQHKCDKCFKTFFERHHLIIHLRSHSGEKPYVCKVPECKKSFVESQKLKRHYNAKHALT